MSRTRKTESTHGYFFPLLLLSLLCITAPLARAAAGNAGAQAAHDILQNRCMVCHGCYDAPCQLKLEARQGLARGASKDLVYDGARLMSADLTRLFDDAHSAQAWRDKGFFPVIDDEQAEDGVLYRMLALKQAHPLPPRGPVDESFDFSLYREQQCTQQADFDDYAEDYPLWGMPFGLPGLQPDEHQVMVRWLKAGAPPVAQAALSAPMQKEVSAWERFLNGDSHKERLMSRYLYEHLFLASLFLEASDTPVWFRLVRSKTPPGEPLELISTRRPYDDPGVQRVYYRLQRMPITPLGKSHLAYRFDAERRDWYRQNFLVPDYTVPELPGYQQAVAANPFKSFVAIPVPSRYRFLLEEAEFTIMNFIKGPVCRGQIALNVIEDRFWVMFLNPDSLDPELDGAFLARESDNLRLPVSETGTAVDLFTWRGYAKSHDRYQKAKVEYLSQQLNRSSRKIGLESLWDGDGDNPNAALTIFRHFDTASVVKGFVGDTPKTAWVISYSLLERIHYLLVAGFDVYGAVAHQLETRLYMDFLRMEGELNFLMYLPPQQRQKLRDYWYRDAPGFARDHVFADSELMRERPTDLSFDSDNPKAELLSTMRKRIHGARAESFDYHPAFGREANKALDALVAGSGIHNSFLPQVSFVSVVGGKQPQTLTLLRDSGYANIALLFLEEERRLPEEDRLTVVKGFIGEHPNLFFEVHEKQLPLFAADIAAMKNEEDWHLLRHRYGVARNAPWFWRLSDQFHQQLLTDPLYRGLLDYNRYLGNPVSAAK
ncbi:fatty acid cis/trans isomerase [Parahaliea mediterranea]|uniref:fatty acid cis/trans isomerase n=1 Tax=Parahaliea mediterranea TaxID=651086 RepID=UPI001F4EEF60|nr:fatty acid cis/trans isomerase [Parahaliea mediterranea]